jgi:3',5'-cyclic AMP phosphodiesterase CpdA
MFHIVHLSDLHLSNDLLVVSPEQKPQRQILDNLALALKKTKQDFHRAADTWMVVVTGDIYDTATLRAPKVAAIMDLLLETLDQALGQTIVVLLPGNHDVRARGIVQCGRWRNRVLPALRAYLDEKPKGKVFLHAKQGAGLVSAVQDDGAPVHLVAYDSTWLPYGLMSAGGMVRAEELLSLFPAVQQTRKPLVLMLHHHLIPTPVADFSVVDSWARHILKRLASNSDYEEVMQTALGAGSALSTLQSLGRPVLVLHGHKHYPCVRLLSGASEASDVLILAAGSTGLTTQYRAGQSPMSIWPSFNHLQIDQQGVQAHIVAYPYSWDGRTQDLSRRLLTDMAYTDCSWQPRAPVPGTCPAESVAVAPAESPAPGRKLALNQSVVSIRSGTAGYADIRKSFEVERTIVVAQGHLASCREGVDCADDATIQVLASSDGAHSKPAKLLESPLRGVTLAVGSPCSYLVSNGLYVSSADFGLAHDKRDAPFESIELLNRYPSEVARLRIRNLLAGYGLARSDCFASITDLTLGTERPVPLHWEEDDSAQASVSNCPPRHRLRIYWPLKSCRPTPFVRRWWLKIRSLLSG